MRLDIFMYGLRLPARQQTNQFASKQFTCQSVNNFLSPRVSTFEAVEQFKYRNCMQFSRDEKLEAEISEIYCSTPAGARQKLHAAGESSARG
jgi:hypothetical protein